MRYALKLGMAALVASIAAAPHAANANLILINPSDVSGAGLGAVNTILTLQNTGTESGCVGFGGTTGSSFGTTNCIGTSADVKQGTSQTKPLTLGGIGNPTAGAFRIVLNATEPTPSKSIRLDSLAVQFYNSAGNLLFNSVGVDCGPLYPNCIFQDASGIGNAGFTFGLDSTQQLQAIAAGAFSSPTNVIGLSTSLSLAEGGPETFFLSVGLTSTPSVVPEPASIALLGLGLTAVGFLRHRKAKQA